MYPLKITFKYIMVHILFKVYIFKCHIIKTSIFQLWYIIADRLVKISWQAFAVLGIILY